MGLTPLSWAAGQCPLERHHLGQHAANPHSPMVLDTTAWAHEPRGRPSSLKAGSAPLQLSLGHVFLSTMKWRKKSPELPGLL